MIDTIINALLGGITAAAGKVATSATMDAYTGLKALVIRKMGSESDAATALVKLEEKPQSTPRRLVLSEELETAGAADDSEIIEAVTRLSQALSGQNYKYTSLVQTATGSYIAQASDGSRATIMGHKPITS